MLNRLSFLNNETLIIYLAALMEIISAKYLISNASYTECPKPDRPEYAFIGRSNVGKSSLINMLCNNSKLAKTSVNPGKTQLINHFEITSSSSLSHKMEKAGKKRMNWYLVDLPGYGYAITSQSSRRRWEQMIENYIRKRENLICLFVLIDSRHEPQIIDLEFINQLGKWEIPFVLVFTKSDKNKPGATTKNVESFLTAMGENWEEPPPYFITSAAKKIGQKPLQDYIEKLNISYIRLK
jgi:GTP-binding protein